MRRTTRLLVLPTALLLALPTAPSTAREPAAPGCAGTHWVGTWATAPSDAGTVPPVGVTRPLADQTVRMVVHPSLSGRTVRVRLTNRYGVRAAAIAHATVAVRDKGAAAVPDTMRTLRFAGSRSVTLPAGRDVASDPVRLPVRAGRDLLVSLHVPGVVDRPTEHWTTMQDGYLGPSGAGDLAADGTGSAFAVPTRHAFSVGWYFLAGVDVRASRSTGAVVAFGDSITDGYQVAGPLLAEDPAASDRNARYPDFLARRLAARDHGPRLAVLNTGISGNRVLGDAESPYPYGLSALHRFRDDVLRVPGATDLLLLEGINDLGDDDSLPARAVVDGLRRLVARAHRAGLRVHLGTLLPAGGAAQGHGDAATARRRAVVNHWIRTRSGADSVVDFDAAVRDPAHPGRLRPSYDSGDHLHPSSAGYRAMAAAVRLADLEGVSCS